MENLEPHNTTQSGSPKSCLRLTSSLSLKNEDVDKQLLLSTSVPIKIGNDNNKKESRKCNNRIRYTFGLRAIKATTAVAVESTNSISNQKNSSSYSNDGIAQKLTKHAPPAQSQSQPEHEQEQPKSKLVDNLGRNNAKKLVKQTTIDYYV